MADEKQGQQPPETGGTQQPPEEGGQKAKPTRAQRKQAAQPDKAQLAAELEALEGKGSINNHDAKRILELRRQIEEST